jgi:hypothetical protein
MQHSRPVVSNPNICVREEAPKAARLNNALALSTGGESTGCHTEESGQRAQRKEDAVHGYEQRLTCATGSPRRLCRLLAMTT